MCTRNKKLPEESISLFELVHFVCLWSIDELLGATLPFEDISVVVNSP